MTKVNVLVLGGGGREHALAWAVSKSKRCGDLVVAPGNAGTPGRRVDVKVDDPAAVCALAKSLGSDLVIIGPDAAIAAGVADALAENGIRAFGASKAASELEWSKSAAREFCERHNIASPKYAVFTAAQLDDAIAYVELHGQPMVVKADGLAAGKGVIVPQTVDETISAIRVVLTDRAFGEASNRVVLEELLVGEEISLLGFCDGVTAVAMPSAQDHKRIGEGDRGANTGGMGAYAPAPVCPPALARELEASVLQRTVAACAAEGKPFHGVLFAGIILTAHGPKVLEFNCRFGDPEAQTLLPLLQSDLLDVIDGCIDGSLSAQHVSWTNESSCTVVVASGGYPETSSTGDVITGIGVDTKASMVFHAGTAESATGHIQTNGGRVVAATATAATFIEARKLAYQRANAISFAGKQMRRDIGWRAIARTTGGYAASGVSIDEGNRAVDLLKGSVEKTHSSSVLAGVGAFGGAFDARMLQGMDHPVLVASTDGVGTKVALAAEANRLGGVGMDLVNHCVNDVLVQNARPVFFLDYIASSKIIPEEVAAVVGGMAEACALNGCALLGGETAEMPGVYHDGHIDVAGTLVGVVEKNALLPRPGIAAGDVMLGLSSSGPHTSGYSLLRRVFAGLPLDAMPAPLERPLGDALLEPHRSYLGALAPLLDGEAGSLVKALVHITGGGLLENLPRVFPSNIGADVQLGSWPVPPLFRLIRDSSGLAPEELHRTLNMGIGMVVICTPDSVEKIRAHIGEEVWVIGELVDMASRNPEHQHERVVLR
jgi:phosphoribosylamine--glycine ligase/phosphoribosylaminoimidazole synthetase